VFALEAGGNNGGHTAKNGSVGIDQTPLAFVIRFFSTVRIFFHVFRTPKFNESGISKQFFKACQEKKQNNGQGESPPLYTEK
jgi:hypothetical protein